MLAVKPVARPRPEQRTPPPPPPFPTVAVKIAVREGIYYFYATDGEQSWSGSSAAPTRDAALLDALTAVRSDLDGPVRFAVSLAPGLPIWQYTAELERALNCAVERVRTSDLSLAEQAKAALLDMLPESAPDPEPELGEPLTVATDGSVRGRFSGYGWLAGDGRHHLHGATTHKVLRRREAILLAELTAIADAIRSLPGRPLIILTDSTVARRLIGAWMGGHDVDPPGFRAATLEQHPPTPLRDTVRDNGGRLTVRWVKGHCGHPLNEGADALARLASRYAQGDSGLSVAEYKYRAEGLAVSFAEEFGRCDSGPAGR